MDKWRHAEPMELFLLIFILLIGPLAHLLGAD